jgi:hypothetical protein
VPGYAGAWRWTRNGRVVASIRMRAEEDCVILTCWRQTGYEKWTDEQYPVRLVRTRCNLGGSRAWFLCPSLGCGRRVAILYGVETFACRYCHQLAYASSVESECERAARRVNRSGARLGWAAGIFGGFGLKPKGMHWETFYRLAAEHNLLAYRAMRAIAFRFDFLDRLTGETREAETDDAAASPRSGQ